MNETAKDDEVFVCSACGKRSKDRYGNLKIDQGWDESCMLHSVLCQEASLVFGENGLVRGATASKRTTSNA